MAAKNYYDILEVSPTATQEEIKKQYRFVLHAWHPDKFPDPDQKARANQKTKEINEAYEVVGDPASRARYDRERAGSPSQRPSSPTPTSQHTAPPKSQSPQDTKAKTTANAQQSKQETEAERQRRYEEAQRFKAEQEKKEQQEAAQWAAEQRRRSTNQRRKIWIALVLAAILGIGALIYSSQYSASTRHDLVSGGLTSDTSVGPAYGYTFFDANFRNDSRKEKFAYFQAKLRFATGEVCQAKSQPSAQRIEANSAIQVSVAFWCAEYRFTNAPKVKVSVVECSLVVGDYWYNLDWPDSPNKLTRPCDPPK